MRFGFNTLTKKQVYSASFCSIGSTFQPSTSFVQLKVYRIRSGWFVTWETFTFCINSIKAHCKVAGRQAMIKHTRFVFPTYFVYRMMFSKHNRVFNHYMTYVNLHSAVLPLLNILWLYHMQQLITFVYFIYIKFLMA